jgi:hypothetical protein
MREDEMNIDRFLPEFDVTEVVEFHVDAPPAVTYEAILDTDLRDPVIDALFAVREITQRLRRRWRGDASPARGPVTFRSMDVSAGPGWTRLADETGVEFVIGSVGRFWKSDYGGRPIAAEDFAAFREPGYAKLAIALSVRPLGAVGTLLRYEARTATTDDKARRAFRRYWRVIRPGVALVMRRAVGRIRREAERRVELSLSA